MVVVWVELVALGVHFEKCGSLRSPVPSLLFSLGFYVELVQEGLDITLVLDGQKAILEVPNEIQLIFSASLSWWISASSTY